MNLHHTKENVVWGFTRVELRALLVFSHIDSSKLDLCGVTLDQEEGATISTDGKRIVCARVGTNTGNHSVRKTALVSKSILDRLVMLMTDTDRIDITIGNGDLAKITIAEVFSLEVELPAVKPVDWKHLFERGDRNVDPPKSFVIDPDFLFDLKTVAEAAGTQFVTIKNTGGSLDLVEAVFEERLGTTWRALLCPATKA